MTKLTFDDEFNTLSLYNGSSGTWQPSYSWAPNGLNVGTSWLVNPMAGGTSAADANIYSVSNGTLSIGIKPTPGDVLGAVGNTPFLSGQLETKPTFSQLYGYFEINAVLPSGSTGISSAFWLLPESGAWPPELDVFEEDTSQGTSAVETGLFTNQSGSNQQIYAWDYNLPNLAAGAHTYGVDWEADNVTWYIDGKQVFQTATPADMHQPMYMLIDDLTTAVGSWNGSPAAGLNTSMQVNWVHAYDSNPYVNGVNTVLGNTASDPGTGTTAPPVATPPVTTPTPPPVTPPVTPSAPPAPVITGSGSDTLVLNISEDAYLGDAQFTVSVDGKQIGGTFTTTALHSSGVSQSFTFNGDWAIGAHAVAVNFLNDAWGGSNAADRNLYVDAISYDGTATGQGAELGDTGARTFSVTDSTALPVATPPVVTPPVIPPVTPPVTPPVSPPVILPVPVLPVFTGSGSDALVLSMSEDAYEGDARFTVSVDGKQLDGTFTTTASHAAGGSQNFYFYGDWAKGAHAVAVNFLNDAYGGSAATDRNLYVSAISYDGIATGQSGTLLGNGPRSFGVTDNTAIPVTPPAPVVTGSGPDSLVLDMSEDAYQGDAQFTVSVDGKQLGGTFTTTALHTYGASQSFTFKGRFGSGQHAVAVKFLNDAWGGTAATDRNLYVNGISYDGAVTGQTAALYGTGPATVPVSDGATSSAGEENFVLSNGDVASVMLGTAASRLSFVGAGSVTLTGGSGPATVTAVAGSNTFVAGTGTLDVTGGSGKDAYVFHANSGLLTIEDFSSAKGDTLTVDKTLLGSMQQTSDGQGGTLLTFGAGATHGIDIHGVATLPASNVLWA
jgi:beta-glucanase (GH16 family)